MAKRTEYRQKLRQALAARGQRFTRQRARVLEVLAATDQHPTAEEVHRRVKQALPAVSLATIYKALDTLVRCGLAQKLTYGDGSARYDANAAAHPHMLDIATGRLLDVPADLLDQFSFIMPPELAEQIQQRTGFNVVAMRVELLGTLIDLPPDQTAES